MNPTPEERERSRAFAVELVRLGIVLVVPCFIAAIGYAQVDALRTSLHEERVRSASLEAELREAEAQRQATAQRREEARAAEDARRSEMALVTALIPYLLSEDARGGLLAANVIDVALGERGSEYLSVVTDELDEVPVLQADEGPPLKPDAPGLIEQMLRGQKSLQWRAYGRFKSRYLDDRRALEELLIRTNGQIRQALRTPEQGSICTRPHLFTATWVALMVVQRAPKPQLAELAEATTAFLELADGVLACSERTQRVQSHIQRGWSHLSVAMRNYRG